jgi:hypothetical protein
MRNLSFTSPLFIACRIALVAVPGLVASPLPAGAETRIFFVENQPDGYGIDQCLASGATCGRPMASAYCRSHEYGEAVSFRKADPDEMLKQAGDALCGAGGCYNFVAIECQR